MQSIADLKILAEELAHGTGTVDTVGVLWQGQIRKRLILLHSVLDEALAHPDDFERAGLASAWEFLSTAQQAHPEIVNRLLLYPATGAWAAHCVRQLRAESPVEGPLWPDLAYLGWLAVAVAYKIQESVLPMPVIVRRGQIMLPSLGLLRWPEPNVTCAGVARLHDGALKITAGGRTASIPLNSQADAFPQGAWRPLPVLRSDHGMPFEVVLDAFDPFRDGQPATDAVTLTNDDIRHWQTCFDKGWGLLLRDHSAYAGPIRAGVQCLVPISASPIPAGASYTSKESFGAIFMTAPYGPRALALSLIHEFQHTKLNALTDFVELTTSSPRCHLYAPWRDDPRPASGLLQGVYAHLAITDFWRVARHSTSDGSPLAAVEFALWREQVAHGMAELRSNAVLTADGEKFVAVLERALAPWLEEPVPAQAQRTARDRAASHRVAWCVRNLTCQSGDLQRLLKLWSQQQPPGSPLPPSSLKHVSSPSDFSSRVPHPGYIDASPNSCAGSVGTAGGDDVLSRAQHAYGQGDFLYAATLYATALTTTPDESRVWEGYAMVLQRQYPHQRLSVLLERAELVAGLYELTQKSNRPAKDPLELADWLNRRDGR